MAEYSPEKAGGGGSTTPLATTFQRAYAISPDFSTQDCTQVITEFAP